MFIQYNDLDGCISLLNTKYVSEFKLQLNDEEDSEFEEGNDSYIEAHCVNLCKDNDYDSNVIILLSCSNMDDARQAFSNLCLAFSRNDNLFCITPKGEA